MKVLLDGSLNQSLQLKDLLSGISQAEAPGLTVLKFAANKEEQGELYFLGGHYIVCALLSTGSVVGKMALDQLLQLKQAEFVYYACDSVDALPQSDNLKIDLKELIDGWQEAKPISEDQLLDKIFNVSATSDKMEALPAVSMQEHKEADTGFAGVQHTVAQPTTKTELASGPRDDVDWDLVEPLVSNGAPGSGTDGYEWTPEEEARATPDLRAMSKGFQWQRELRKLLLLMIMFTIISIAIMIGVWLLINAPSAHLGPRRYPVPIERHPFHRAP